ncbi:zinc ABC transporter permease subunit ZnuB [Buchnera aphidicola (Aphis craccivora)]|uniref:High-affinity zinc uptake system membrane protein ZnuB n=1 Tax=Buchnera aphidicola (Aphis craccivora) TaxID=466616 RepID=A0A4D6XJM6_9GAMM|nr:zinc ABC transporter permease subunit ZnuB [Buchnera aphidicola]QCI16563.1 zinc ABC transporter permease subunit ZnuB [Buchnera aphidicola (Aphis craccivora)]QLL40696.1 zinc ABC transporter permease subunit ZnuB [Buchnera aphidicola (Aphis craccivore)]WAI17534.1 MAG: zinc ABC transporter permease subunit ZnuB [Buchnera aphidicola (Aphis craccivora)]
MFKLIFPGWLSGVFLSFATGPLGSFIVWRRMSSFGDTLSHSSLLALAISIVVQTNSFYIILGFISLLAIFLAWLEKILPISLETILTIISHSSLSLGMILVSFISNSEKIDFNSYLFGDLLSIKISDLITIFLGSIIVLIVLIIRWNSILLVTINPELAQIDGINIFYTRLTLMLTTALTISIAIKFVGALLITSLLVIPPATAQYFSNSPEKMAMIGILVSVFSITGGIILSIFFKFPTSPSIVLFSSFLYFLSTIKNFFYKKR